MCVFCNQRSISGKVKFERETVRGEIEMALATIPRECEVEIAFFGGSFTGIDRELMIYLLDVAQSFVDKGKKSTENKEKADKNGELSDNKKCGEYARVVGIRMSTRPDYIDDEILDILSNYTISAIELGLQSMSEEVLERSKRGHNRVIAEQACAKIVQRGYNLVGQMMIGLPGSTPESEIYTAKRICELGAVGARIYPTVVFYDTELAQMALRGEYKPLEIEEAVLRSADVFEIFENHGVECIRIGLCASENLSDDEKVLGGANHPAMGELVEGEYTFRQMKLKIEEMGEVSGMVGKDILFKVPRGKLSIAIGQRGKNRDRLKEIYGFRKVIIKEDDTDSIYCEM